MHDRASREELAATFERWCAKAAFVALLWPAAPSYAARLAFVVGNDNYQHVGKLRNAGADAETIAAAFAKAGYQVTLRRDLDLRRFKDDFRAFRARIGEGDEVLLYYSGHGVGLAGTNFLLPIDVRAESQEQVRDDAVPLTTVLEDIAGMRPGFTLVIVDACRDNPFPKVGRAIGEKGLMRPINASGQMVMYSAGEGQQALDRLGDDDPVRNGVFARVFVSEMERVGLPVDQVLKNVRVEVNRIAKSVKRNQIPALYSEVLGDYYFYPPDSRVTGVKPTPALPPAPAPHTEVTTVPVASATAQPETAALDAAVDNRFLRWAATWGFDRYTAGSARIATKQCKESSCTVAGNFNFTRFGFSYDIPFNADVNQGAVTRLCYQDNSTNRRDCTND